MMPGLPRSPKSLESLPDEALTWVEFIAIVARVLDLPLTKAPEAVLNPALAESALAAPHAGFGGVPIHADPIARAAVLGVKICRNHSLVDGNKRVALIAMSVQLRRIGLRLNGTQMERAATVEAMAAGTMSDQEFGPWVRVHIEAQPS